MDFNRAEPTCYRTNFPNKMELFRTHVHSTTRIRLTYTLGLIRFVNCARLSHLIKQAEARVMAPPMLLCMHVKLHYFLKKMPNKGNNSKYMDVRVMVLVHCTFPTVLPACEVKRQ